MKFFKQFKEIVFREKDMAHKVSQLESTEVKLGEIKEFKNPVSFHRIPITYKGKPLIIIIIIEAKCKGTLFENKYEDKVTGYSLRLCDFDEDFISKIESLTDEIKSKVEEFAPEIKKLMKRNLDTDMLSILHDKEGCEQSIFAKLFTKKVHNKLVIQTMFQKKLVKEKAQMII